MPTTFFILSYSEKYYRFLSPSRIIVSSYTYLYQYYRGFEASSESNPEDGLEPLLSSGYY